MLKVHRLISVAAVNLLGKHALVHISKIIMCNSLSVLEFKVFLDSRKECWLSKQKEVERRFLELEQVQSTFQEPRKKKRKTAAKEQPLSSLGQDSFANFAAELQTEFFVKVQTTY